MIFYAIKINIKKKVVFIKLKEKDFFIEQLQDLNALKYNIDYNNKLLYKKDDLKRSLLYLSAKNGYYNLTKYLLKKDINMNEVQRNGSTALHEQHIMVKN